MSFNLPLGPTPAAATSSSPISDSASFVPANDNVLDSEFNSSDVGVEAEEKREASPDAPASTSTSSPTPEARPMAEALLARCTSLLEEIEAFQHGLRRNNLEKSIQLRPFLNQWALEPLDSGKSLHGVQASNLPYHEALWGYAKRSTGIVGLCRTFSYTEPCHPRGGGARRGKKKASVTVDIVARNGLEWIKVSLLTPRRLLFEIAKAGWEDATGFSDDDDDNTDDDDDDDSLLATDASITTTATNANATPTAMASLAVASTSLSNVADNLLLAASQTRVQYLHPTITFILPRLSPTTTTTPEVTVFLAMLQQKGITVRTTPSFLPAPSIEDILSALASPVARRAIPITDSVNLDTTVLLALISDISHLAFAPSQSHSHPAIQRQLDMEKTTPMVPCHLLPVLQHRALITSVSSRRRFAEIVGVIATDTERERARLLLIDDSADADSKPPLTPAERAARMAELSMYDCSALQLPVVTVPDHKLADTDPPGFRQVADKLSPVNRAAFLTGWVRGLTTVTSNRAVAKLIEAVCGGISCGGGGCGGEQEGEEEEAEVVGPDVWVVESARSLVCKQSGSGTWSRNDPSKALDE